MWSIKVELGFGGDAMNEYDVLEYAVDLLKWLWIHSCSSWVVIVSCCSTDCGKFNAASVNELVIRGAEW